MDYRKPLALAMASALLVPPSSVLAATFRVEDIEIQGLERISPDTVFSYLPVKVGDDFDEASSAEVLRTLYKTGLFDDVMLRRRDGVLLVVVEERAAIAEISITGNKDISTDDLNEALKGVGIARGRVFNRSVLERLKTELVQQYFARGKYNVKVDTEVKDLDSNRVSIDIDIAEGDVAKIRRVNIVGNEALEEKKLLKKFNSGTSPWFKFWSSRDQYSKPKLAGDLETLRSDYLDKGFLQFSIESTQVSITPDKKDIFITINVDEGDQYTVKDVKLSGDFIVGEDELKKLVEIEKGQTFSRAKVVQTTEAISKRLGDEGYAFANVNPVPELDEDKKEVSLTFFVDPGQKVYVRRITFYGNQSTRDEVFRRESRQMEGSTYSATALDQTRRRLQRLPFVASAEIETKRVPGVEDQVDLDVRVTERLAGNFAIGAGFSQTQGILFNVSLTQNNFLGTGKSVSVAFNNSDVNRIYSFGYTNPYYTVDGISRGFSVRYTQTEAGDADISDFEATRFGANVNYGIPLSEYDTLRLSAGVEGSDISETSRTPQEIRDFIDREGDNYINFLLNAGFAHDTRNRTVFADRGSLSRFNLEVAVPGSELEYYKADIEQQNYFPLTDSLTLSVNGRVAYGDGYGGLGELPFFENYFAGGFRSVRGYKGNSLGPRVVDPVDPDDTDPFGGAFSTVGSVELIFPAPFIGQKDKLRLSTFFDVGNVFQEFGDFEASELRQSAGLGVTWITPVGALSFSIAAPLNDESDDDTEPFQFNLGTLF